MMMEQVSEYLNKIKAWFWTSSILLASFDFKILQFVSVYSQALVETKELLQREQTAHLIAMLEVEKQEEKLTKALGVEKECANEGEEKLAELCRLVNQREELASDNDDVLIQKQLELEEAQKKIEIGNSALRTKEDETRYRMENLALKDKVIFLRFWLIDMLKVVYLLHLYDSSAGRCGFAEELRAKIKGITRAREEAYYEREKVKKLLNEHKAILDAKTHDFELEMEQKRKSLDNDFKIKVAEVEKKEVKVNHLERKITKREEALEKKLDKIKEKEKDVNLEPREPNIMDDKRT
ncbi:hypothetical protein L1987_82132 [Smallanthus sonchifolius]|uniref:Uncharacterized protein n=1 Tax=Smallanthus sonchifolius TaxID=185202 RepID=A0ACB8YTZ4_9ASTR|nr:hypothetical protein L1987_82132 [Smallanthus sonchifolius]